MHRDPKTKYRIPFVASPATLRDVGSTQLPATNQKNEQNQQPLNPARPMNTRTTSAISQIQTRSSIIVCGLVLLSVLTSIGYGQTINRGIIDPTNVYAGKTYAQWSAAWWQYYFSLPATNNPFVFVPSYPVPLAINQSGPVWFLGHNYLGGGVHSFTNTIPGGIALFSIVSGIEWDNVNCPTHDNFTLDELLAFATPIQDDATNMSCTIDGAVVDGLTDGLTTPYRVQSLLFNYMMPAVHNLEHDLFGLTCYQNSTGMPYTVNGAASDSIFLMIAPLSVGPHVLHITASYPDLSPPYLHDTTHYLTVQPVSLSVNPNRSPGSVVLSWPQTSDNYTLETSPDLLPGHWQTTNPPVTVLNLTNETSVNLGQNLQFFRLRLN